MTGFIWVNFSPALMTSTGVAAAEPVRFDSLDAAVAAPIAALEAGDTVKVLRILGPQNQDVVLNGDPRRTASSGTA